ncbi:hypothetical protein WR25_11518 [Diploscapter pachys]|uniref:Uncharacterized protein n=1 Tax=Diploscapter pachys TaxID=2018661 RepID=A0A2A2JK74_9BILA|nr:hypothetical protein WR25_11518 [Diploscapter pachys]
MPYIGIDEDRGELSLVRFLEPARRSGYRDPNLGNKFNYREYIESHRSILDIEKVEGAKRREALVRSSFISPNYTPPKSNESFLFLGPGSQRRGLLFRNGAEAICGLSEYLFPRGYFEKERQLIDGEMMTDLERHMYSVILNGKGRYHFIANGGASNQRTKGYLIPIISQIIKFKMFNVSIGPILIIVTSTYQKAKEISKKFDEIRKHLDAIDREFVPISLFANDVSLPGTLQQAQCDILIGTVEKIHEFVQHMLSLEPEYFQCFRYLAIEQAQFFAQKEESGADSREMEEEERLNVLGEQAEGNAGGFAGAVTEFWLTLPEQIQNPKNLTVMFISSRCLPSLYDHFLSGVMLSGKSLLFIQELKTYGRANVEFLQLQTLVDKLNRLMNTLKQELRKYYLEGNKRIVIACKDAVEAGNVFNYLNKTLPPSKFSTYSMFLATVNEKTPDLEENEFTIWRCARVRNAVAVCDMPTCQLIVDDGHRTSKVIFYSLPPINDFNTIIEYCYGSLNNLMYSFGIFQDAYYFSFSFDPISLYISPIQDLQYAEKLYLAAHYYGVKVPQFIQEMRENSANGNLTT